jgi:hypothetical protein
MSLESGLVLLVQADATVLALCKAGGYLAQLPPNSALPSWTQQTISEPVDYLLSGPDALVMRRIQIDVYGKDPADAVELAFAIDKVLSGYKGTLPDGTRVQGCFRDNKLDFFDSEARSFRRMLDYRIFSFPN